jgi:hypothetical protein
MTLIERYRTDSSGSSLRRIPGLADISPPALP